MAKATTETAATEQAVNKFALSKLRANCLKIFGVTSTVFAGATADLPDGEYTKQEIKTAIEKWLKKEAK